MTFVPDERVRLLEPAYLEAEKRTAYYMRRGFWKAAEKWADAGAIIYAAMSEIGRVEDGERADAS